MCKTSKDLDMIVINKLLKIKDCINHNYLVTPAFVNKIKIFIASLNILERVDIVYQKRKGHK